MNKRLGDSTPVYLKLQTQIQSEIENESEAKDSDRGRQEGEPHRPPAGSEWRGRGDRR